MCCDRTHLVREAEERRKLKKEPPHAEAAQNQKFGWDGHRPRESDLQTKSD